MIMRGAGKSAWLTEAERKRATVVQRVPTTSPPLDAVEGRCARRHTHTHTHEEHALKVEEKEEEEEEEEGH
jgi:hypothetical protein